MIPVRHVVIAIEKESTDLISLMPNLTLDSIDGMTGLISFSYAYDRDFSPNLLWTNGVALAIVETNVYSQLVIGEPVDYLKTSGLMALIVSDLEYMSFELENAGPKVNKEESYPAYVTVTCSFDRSNLDVFFLGDK
jgi:hypothetical protein